MPRILHLADLHYSRIWFEWVIANASKYDAVVLAGDCLDAFKTTRLRTQAKDCREWVERIPVPTLICSGNHDVWIADPRATRDTTAEGGWVRHLRGKGHVIAVDGDIVELAGLRIAVAGWLKPRWPDCDLVVYHAPPAGCSCAANDNGKDFGDLDAADYLRESAPKLYLSGHIHTPRKRYGLWPVIDPETLVLVPGFSATDVPHHWIIDIEKRQAFHSEGDVVEL